MDVGGGGHLRASFGIPRSRSIVEQMSNEISDSGGNTIGQNTSVDVHLIQKCTRGSGHIDVLCCEYRERCCLATLALVAATDNDAQ